MKVITVVGTRPEIIRCAEIIKKLDKCCEHILVDTNQNSQDYLSGIFYRELGVREPDYKVGTNTKSVGHQLGANFVAIEEIIAKEKPDKAFCPCDTNTSMVAFIFERNNVPVYHLEAGNRCFDRKVAEETNRRAIDAICSYNLPYTSFSKQHLLNEGMKPNHIFVTGNPMYEIMQVNKDNINNSTVLEKLGLTPKEFILLTCHRQETVDYPKRIKRMFAAINEIAKDYKIVYPVHPRAMQKIQDNGIQLSKNIITVDPLGFFDLIKLEKNAHMILTDSGTVQEEACIVGTPAIILRTVTERPEVIECGACVLGGVKFGEIINAYKYINDRDDFQWIVPTEYLYPDVSTRVVTFMMSKQYEDLK